MIKVIALDTAPLGIATTPKLSQMVTDVLTWIAAWEEEGCRFVVPSVAVFELKRELIRCNKQAGIASLERFIYAYPDRYLPLTDTALHHAAELWAKSRNAGNPTADPKELDCDVLIAAQILELGLEEDEYVIATANVKHLGFYAVAKEWQSISLE